jgi:RHS repeat-associated protein
VILTSAYDAANNRTSLAATIAGVDDFLSSSTYNALNQLTRLAQTGQSGGNNVAEKRIDFAYNAIGQFTSIARYKDTTGGSTHEVATSTYSYDLLNRLTGLVYKEGSTNLFAPYAWSFDNLSRITQQVSEDGTSDYAYDSTSQLTTADHDYQADEAYSYDANGNRTMTGYSTGTNNRLLSDGTHTYTYDFEGNRTKKTVTATGEATEYQWDHRNRLVQVKHLDSVGDPVQTLDYIYDVLDRRIGKTDTPAVGPAYTERYVYDGEHLALKFGSSALANRYLHGPVIDQILADERVSSLSSVGDVLWPLVDNLGTVRDLAEYDSGTGDTVIVNHIAYDAYGGSRAETNAAVDHLFGYTGREWDAEADLQYNRARWYDPAVGRWLSEDPIGFEAGDGNLNRFVTNNPTNHFDPDGLRQRSAAWGPEYPRNQSESAAYAQWFAMNLPDMNNDFVINTWDVLDYVANGGAGLGDGVTYGYLNDAREYLGTNGGIDQTSAIYTAGLYTGTAVGMGISGGAGGGAAATGWAVRTGRVYVMAGRADDAVNIATRAMEGTLTPQDMLAAGLPGRGAGRTANGMLGMQAPRAPVLRTGTCQVDPLHHNANVAVYDADGRLTSHARLVSGNMTPAERSLGFPRGSLASHTEARAVLQTRLQEGQTMVITGQRPPCPTCRGYMNRAAQESGATIRYRWREDGTTQMWQALSNMTGR